MTALTHDGRARLLLESLAQEAQRVIWEVDGGVDLLPPGPRRDRVEALLVLTVEFNTYLSEGLSDLVGIQQEQDDWERDNHDDPVDDQ